jgi:hypothetical protein
VVEKISVDNDLTIGKTSINFSTIPDGVSSSIINVYVSIWKVIENIKVDFRLGFPESEHDTKYLRQFMRNNVDVKKLTKGIKGNSFIQAAVNTVLADANFKLELPFKPGNYSIRNIAFTGDLFPPILSTLFLVDINVYIKLSDKKKMIMPLTIKIYGKLN